MARLFATTDALKQALGNVNMNVSIETMGSYLDQAWEMFMVPYIGRNYGDAFCDAYATDDLDANDQLLLTKIQVPLANFAYKLYADDGGLIVDEAGITTQEDERNKRPYQWQVRDFKKNRLTQGWQGVRTMLGYLDRNADIYETWWDSDERKALWALVIWDVNTFNRYRKLDGMGTLAALQSYQIEAVETSLSSCIGADFYAAVVEWLQERETDASMTALLPYVEKYVAWKTIELGATDLPLEITATGIYLNEVNQGLQNDESKKMAALDKLKITANTNAGAAAKSLRNFLDANASGSVYAEYYNSDLYDVSAGSGRPDSQLFKGPTFFM
jgi:hypothetical protein